MSNQTTAPRLQGKTALVTGASRGIGRAIAEAYASQGANLFLTATDERRLAETAELVRAAGGSVEVHVADMSEPEAVSQTFTAAERWTGEIDVLVNNAGIYIGKPFTDYSLEEFDQVMRVNLYAVFQLMQAALVHMQRRGSGSIVNIASTAGKWESLNQAAYNASKHAVVGLTRCAALENAARGVNVNAICPGMVETDMFSDFKVHADASDMNLDQLREAFTARIPMGRFLEADEVAALAVYLGSNEAAGMTGQTITISGGMRMG